MSETPYTKGNLQASCVDPDTTCRCGYLFDEFERVVAKAFHGQDGTNGVDPDITVEEMKANSSRIAHCWNNYDQMETDRNRWRSVAEHLEKFARFQKENGAVGPVGERLMNEGLSAFDSLRKEGGHVS